MDRKNKADFFKGFTIGAIALGTPAVFALIAFWILF